MSTTRERRSKAWRRVRFQAKIDRFVADAIATANRKWPRIAVPNDLEFRPLWRERKGEG